MQAAATRSSLLAALLFASPLKAQLSVEQQDLRNFAPPTDPEGALYLEKPTTEGEGAYNVGLWMSYANQLLVLESASGVEASPLEHQFSIDYLASLGFNDQLSLGIAVPTVVYQSGDHEELLGDAALPRSALGDVRADLKVTLLQPGTLGTLALGALLRGTLPTSRQGSYAGYDSVTGEARFLAELSYLTTKLQLTGGARFHEQVKVLDETLGTDLPWGAAALFNLTGNGRDEMRWVLGLETHGSVGLEPSFADEISSPLLAGISMRMLQDDWSVLVGAEAGLNGGLGGPRARAVVSLGYAPRVKDADHDTLEDHVDQCPEVPEDLDGFQDSDGCPEVDNDGDGVSDTDDRCPQELEDNDDFQDDDGCPDPDNDGDGILDASDACPLLPGTPSDVPKYHGCPPVDTDEDGIFDDKDRCKRRPEDKDGFQDDDGCPDLDNDRDGIEDSEDACPNQRGPRREDPKLHGCPNPDRDGDTFDTAQDQCPKEREVFNGLDDEDGCPDGDPKANPALVEVLEGNGGPSMRLSRPIEFSTSDGGVEVAPQSLPLLRAIGTELNQHRRWVLLVGVRPAGASYEAEQEALNKSFAVVLALRSLTHREDLAESVGWNAVKGLTQAKQHGMGLMVLAPDKHRRRRPRTQ